MQSKLATSFVRFARMAQTGVGLRRLPALIFVLLLICPFANSYSGRTPDLTAEDYCRLTVSLMELSVHEWQERIPVAEKNTGDRKKLETALQDVTKKYQDLRNEKYQQAGLDQRAYLQYTADHKTEIESYLEDNPEVQGAIDNLKSQIDNLIQQFESASGHHEGV